MLFLEEKTIVKNPFSHLRNWQPLRKQCHDRKTGGGLQI